MQAIEFEATTFQHTIRVPDNIPDGVRLRVLLLVDDKTSKDTVESGRNLKNLLAGMPDVGDDRDFSRADKKTREAALAHIAATRIDWQGKPIPDRDSLYDDARKR